MKPLTIQEIERQLRDMKVDNNILYAIKVFGFVVKGPDGKPTTLKNVFIGHTVTQNGDRHYCSPGIIDKIQRVMNMYGEIYEII